MQKNNLPIQQIAAESLKCVNQNSTSLLFAPPGAGKSTWLPYFLLNNLNLNGKKIVMIEPRRLAAKSVATRLASLFNEEVGKTVGYKVRFESKTSEKTKLEIVTEGVFLNYIINDNLLDEIGLIIFDEFHERSLQSDLSLSLCLQLQQILRPDLKLLIMSATLDLEEILNVIPNAGVLKSEGKMFPVHFHYIKEEENNLNLNFISTQIIEITQKTQGDILVFLPGAFEINKIYELLDYKLGNIEIHKLYGELNITEQQKAITPSTSGKRKIVLSTSIAETSLTIEGINTVIDSGWMRVSQFDKTVGLNKLITQRVTKDAAIQRAGRAGRLTEGNCYRLYTEATFNRLVDKRKPEIISADLNNLVLTLANWGSINLNDYTFVTKPELSNFQKTITLLEELGALNQHKITDHGKKLSQLATHPRLANMIIYAQEKQNNSILLLAIDLLAILEEKDSLKDHPSIDIWHRLSELNKYRKKQRANADINILTRIDKSCKWWSNYLNIKDTYELPECEIHIGDLLARAYPDRIAKKVEQNIYKLSNGYRVSIPLNDELIYHNWLVIPLADVRDGIGKAFLASSIDAETLTPLCKDFSTVIWNEKNNKAEGVIRKVIGSNIISEKINQNISTEELQVFLIEKIKESNLKVLELNDEFKNIQARVAFLINQNNLGWKSFSNENLLLNLNEWLLPYLGNITTIQKIKELNITDLVLNWLGYEEQLLLNKLAPTEIEVPSGSKIKINYTLRPDQPILEVRLQEIFGWTETPSINNGKNKLLIHLLSPGYKAVQVTQDLKSFWQNGYHEVKKELKQRYPKHSWPDNPLQAEAVRGVKRKL